jgi:hypothetical protein
MTYIEFKTKATKGIAPKNYRPSRIPPKMVF